ncbi:unnamed protein product [Adineta ricciae]|uniref:Carbonic anhydrase n=1 Tax=Adineta ricciae TaxID=249248 RepID=A0A813TJ59_ADIRI|nr:unnamed protein product [Adineta ricciae]CAF1053085.1 unnamed protein product [Adineta ricciae]
MSLTTNANLPWTYDNPPEWHKHYPYANGTCQSPIDIDTLDTIPHMYPPFLFSSKYYMDHLFTLTNTGQQIKTTLFERIDDDSDDALWFSGSSLPGRFHFVDFHLHWGHNVRCGSEHEINGHRFPAEVHFVYRNRNSEQIAVLAFFFTVVNDDAHDHSGWKRYTEVVSQLMKTHSTTTCTFNLGQLMPIDNGEFFRYVGSLTTPPCTEGIIWTIFSHTIPIKGKSLNLLRQNGLRTTYRPTQPLNGRTIFRNYYSKYDMNL